MRIYINTNGIGVNANTAMKINFVNVILMWDKEPWEYFQWTSGACPNIKGNFYLSYLSNLPRFDVLVLAEIGARNIDISANLFDDYNFLCILPDKNAYGGVAIYVSDSLNDVFLTNSQSKKKACTCPRCEIESLVIDFTHCWSTYTIYGLLYTDTGIEMCYIS